jgi:hypothetical protein
VYVLPQANFPHLRTSNTVVKIEEYKTAAVVEPGTRLLKWSFGADLDTLAYGYVIRFSHEDDMTKLEWQYGGESCTGIFNSGTSTAVLNFFLRTSTLTITYRILDANTLAVTIVEVDEANTPCIQFGQMLRFDESTYAATKD